MKPSERQAIEAWLVERGLAAGRVKAMRAATLQRAYSDPRYLRSLLTRGDYAPAAMRGSVPSWRDGLEDLL